ncbi:MAG: NnrU family protein [Halioglobus sp.]
MWLLSFGVLLFCVTHLIPSLLPNTKTQLVSRLGENGYKGIFSLALLLSIACIVFGWRSAAVNHLYQPEPALRDLALGLVVLAFLLMVAASRQTRLKRIVRHPQLTGVILWASAHLLLNGDNRSLVLFGGLAAWSLIEIFAINQREGAWVKPDIPSWGNEVLTAVITCFVIAVLVGLHPYIAGMPVVV